MNWTDLNTQYESYLQLEKGLSDNTVEAYLRDLHQFQRYLSAEAPDTTPAQIQMSHIEEFLSQLYDTGIHATSQARILSGLKSFFNFLVIQDIIQELPTEFIDAPKILRPLPDVLSVGEIKRIFAAVDLSLPQGHRNRAILEVLYSCGLRVSELVNLRLNDLFFSDEYIRVTGKGDKQRLVPISTPAIQRVRLYLEQRFLQKVDTHSQEFVFLNRNGQKLSRVMIFKIIKQLAQNADISKTVSPHTFRHSFATHLLQNGADIRVVQEMLGHESILTTEIYTHLNREHLHDALRMAHPLSDE